MVTLVAIVFAGVLIAAPATFAETEEHADHGREQHSRPVEGRPVEGRVFYQVCQTCHGESGEGDARQNAPRIAGQAEWYLIRQLQNFRSGIRGASPADATGAQMRAMAMTLPDHQALLDVVAYVKTFPERKPTPSIQGDPEHGRKIFLQCAACHGAGAEGNELFGAPRLNGQNDWYLVAQLKKLKAGGRGWHPADHRGFQMASVTALLENERDMLDVVAYIGSLP